MRKINPWSAVLAGGAGLVLAGTVAFAAPSAPLAAVPANPTQQEALDGLETARLYIQQHPDTPIPTTPPATTTAAPTTVPPSTDPANFQATAGDQKIVLTWAKPLGGTPTGYIYGRNGVDNTGGGPWTSPAQPATTFTVTLDKLINGTAYQVFVEAVYASGNKRVTLTRTPGPASTTPPATTPPATITVSPTVPAGSRASGLPWSSGAWTNHDLAQSNQFTSIVRGGRAFDNFAFHTWRDTQASQNLPNEWRTILPATFDQTKQNLVLALTSWTADGAFMTSGQAAAIGTSLCSIDTTGIVRLDWEMNLQDGAGANGAVLTASNYTAWVARFRTVATGIKSTCPGARIDFNPNHGADQTTGCNSGTYAAPNNCSRRAFQAVKDVVDIFGIDRYDAYPVVGPSNAGWSGHLNGYNELDESRTYALANGKKWSVPEWGLWTGGAGGNDDPTYITDYIGYFAAHAGDVAYEDYFNEPNPYIISDLITHNPNGRAAYRASLLALP